MYGRCKRCKGYLSSKDTMGFCKPCVRIAGITRKPSKWRKLNK